MILENEEDINMRKINLDSTSDSSCTIIRDPVEQKKWNVSNRYPIVWAVVVAPPSGAAAILPLWSTISHRPTQTNNNLSHDSTNTPGRHKSVRQVGRYGKKKGILDFTEEKFIVW